MNDSTEMFVNQLLSSTCFNPHNFLGLHEISPNQKIIRLWRPGAQELYFEFQGKIIKAEKEHSSGLFTHHCNNETKFSDYRVYNEKGQLNFDPYGFWPTFGEMDHHLFAQGVHYDIFDALGARIHIQDGVEGVKVAVWAPNALGVAIVGDFNYWNGLMNPLRSLGSSGVWEIFLPGIQVGEKYKFEIKTKDQVMLIKADPYALFSEYRPRTSSVVWNVNKFNWTDHDWMEHRKQYFGSKPINIYELHLAAWKKKDGYPYGYREIAPLLADYCLEMGYTHIEVLPLLEHPLDESWGYQVSGFFAVTSRYGNPEDFQFLVNHLHTKGIGIILDWVPAHFPSDEFSISHFDGSTLYETPDDLMRHHPHWNTLLFDYGRKEVLNFLLGSALFWISKMHIDGLRVDAVASMIYLDYGRNAGQWSANRFGGRENLEAIEFLKHLNSVVHERHPGVMMIAEESSSFPGVTHDLQHGGLGFDLKWNMGWMNDTLSYFSKAPIFRKYHQNDLTFSFMYQYSERFLLVLSHDEVVHGKGSLIRKMPGDDWQKFANIRLLLSYMICHPGKKLLFMGCEIAQWNEWSVNKEIEWFLLDYETHRKTHAFVKKLNHFYLQSQALWEWDLEPRGFDCIHVSDHENSVVGYLRKSSHQHLLCVHNFNSNCFDDYRILLGNVHSLKEVFNSDSEEFGGSGKINTEPRVERDNNGRAFGVSFKLSPLATMVFEVYFEVGKS